MAYGTNEEADIPLGVKRRVKKKTHVRKRRKVSRSRRRKR